MARLFLTRDEIDLLAQKTNADCAYEIAKQYFLINLSDVEKQTQRFRKKRLYISIHDFGNDWGFNFQGDFLHRCIKKKIFYDYRLNGESMLNLQQRLKVNNTIEAIIQNGFILGYSNKQIEIEINQWINDYLYPICTNVWHSHTDWEQYDP